MAGMHVVVLTELNAFWYEWVKDQIPGWKIEHDGSDTAIMYDRSILKLVQVGRFKVYGAYETSIKRV